MKILKHLAAAPDLTRATHELEVSQGGSYYFGFRSNSTAEYELKLGAFAAEYTDPSSIDQRQSDLTVYAMNGKIYITSGINLRQVIVSDISGKPIYCRTRLGEKTLCIPVSNLLSGIYLLQIADENGSTVRKIKL